MPKFPYAVQDKQGTQLWQTVDSGADFGDTPSDVANKYAATLLPGQRVAVWCGCGVGQLPAAVREYSKP